MTDETIEVTTIEPSKPTTLQGLKTSPRQLRMIANLLEKELMEHRRSIKSPCTRNDVLDLKCMVTIKNKEGLSDTWEFE